MKFLPEILFQIMHYSIVSIVLAILKNSQELDRTLQSMLNPNQLHGIQQAVDLLVDAYQQQQKIVIVGDFDADWGNQYGAFSISFAYAGLY